MRQLTLCYSVVWSLQIEAYSLLNTSSSIQPLQLPWVSWRKIQTAAAAFSNLLLFSRNHEPAIKVIFIDSYLRKLIVLYVWMILLDSPDPLWCRSEGIIRTRTDPRSVVKKLTAPHCGGVSGSISGASQKMSTYRIKKIDQYWCDLIIPITILWKGINNNKE